MRTLHEVTPGVLELVDGHRVLATATVAPSGTYSDLRVDLADPTIRASAFEALVPAMLSHADVTADGRSPRWWVLEPDDVTDQLADRFGLIARRDLLQLRRPLPLDDLARSGRDPLATRPIRLGGPDVDAVVEVNNRAFAWHPDQAGRDASWIRDTAREPWFDAEGFLLHELDGHVVGFCWTKVHHDQSPPVGEIYVIAVDPSAHGRGLGRGLTVAGLDHLAARDITVAMLYVEALNTSALALYERLGFVLHQRQRAYQPVSS
jgi:mycothiol synthase